MNEYYVYGYRWNEEWVYVGAGSGYRKTHHLKPSVIKANIHKPFYKLLSQIVEAAARPEIVVIDENLSKERAFELEERMIEEIGLKRDGKGPLLNMSRKRGVLEGELHPMYGQTGTENPSTKFRIIAVNLSTGIETEFIGEATIKAAGFSSGSVWDCLSGRRKTHKGHAFRKEPL